MGMATREAHSWTADQLHALPDDGRRYEAVDGELFVTPSPGFDHQGAVVHLAGRLRDYLAHQPSVGVVRVAPGDVAFGAQTLVQPDVFVVPLVAGRRPATWADAARPQLVVEVLSPATARADRVSKRALYQRVGIPEYWIVDTDARVIERWRPTDARPEIVDTRLVWQPEGASEALTVDLAEFWADVFER